MKNSPDPRSRLMATTSPTAKEIFFDAIEIADPEQRAAFLDQAYGGDPARQAEVEALLKAHQAAGQFLGGDSPTCAPAISERPGESTVVATLSSSMAQPTGPKKPMLSFLTQ